MGKVDVFYKENQDQVGVQIKINEKEATLADLLNAWQPLCDDENLYKAYVPGNYHLCKGCLTNCCNTAYVIPDLIAFKKMAQYLGLDYPEFIAGYFQTEKLDTGLLRMKPEPCIFLKNNICSIYPIRSLICRFYLCTKLSGPVEQFIYNITWTGITALQVFAEHNSLLCPKSNTGLTSMDMMFLKLLDEYRDSANVDLFLQADNYRDIPLLPFIDDYTRPCLGGEI